MTTKAATAACSATHISEVPLSHSFTDEDMACLALLLMANKKKELPDQKEMKRLICLYGPEDPMETLDFSYLKPSQCYLEHIFKAFNPTFAERFYRCKM
jgi:hypothetical protein